MLKLDSGVCKREGGRKEKRLVVGNERVCCTGPHPA